MDEQVEPLSLTERLPEGRAGVDVLFDIFVEWTAENGFELYEAQEEAILEIFDDNHVILNTPTGSGKSMVALAMHFYSYATGRKSYYTSPIKALVNEKFFDLCRVFGAENVGMSTGDASINPGAPIICCTAEILASIALMESESADVQHVIMDEFHYYGDRERGIAWQLPLLLLPQTAFLLMSATLGDTTKISDQLFHVTKRHVALVKSTHRPVPLEFRYSMIPLLEQIQETVEKNLAPVYVVNFTQRECAELAQSLTSINFATKEEKERIKEELYGQKFDTPYGDTVRKYLAHGIALHHGGMLPKYRLLVERLAQLGLIKVIVGTDTLGVGINMPLRTVLFSKLCKYDGDKVRLLKVRDFKQIAGRAGRKGYDNQGLVVAQAPEYVIENIKIDYKIAMDPKKGKKMRKAKPPEKGFVHWDEEVFERLTHSESEELSSRFTVTHGMLLNLLQRPAKLGPLGYRSLISLIALSHGTDGKKGKLRRKARMLFQSLKQAEILEVVPKVEGRGQVVRLHEDLQQDFSIHHALSLFLVHIAGELNPESPTYAVTLLSFVEAILEDPRVVLMRQRDKARDAAYAELKAQGAEYEELKEKLEKVDYPQPDADIIYQSFNAYAQRRPWVGSYKVQPKSVARDMYERYATFNEYVNQYGLERSEGVLLRQVSQTYKALRQNVPEQFKTEEVHNLIAYLRDVISRADNSLVQEWEMMRDGIPPELIQEEVVEALDADKTAFAARIRAELRGLVGALATDNLEEAAGLLRQTNEKMWTPMGLERELEPFYAEYERIEWNHDARSKNLINITRESEGVWSVTQVLLDNEGDNEWFLKGSVRVADITDPTGRLFALEEIGH
jgi:superfamily II RNA helicase